MEFEPDTTTIKKNPQAHLTSLKPSWTGWPFLEAHQPIKPIQKKKIDAKTPLKNEKGKTF
jgi:hypothetical protein